MDPVPEKKPVKKPENKVEQVKASEANGDVKITETAQEPKLKVIEEPETEAEQEEIQKVKEEALEEPEMESEVKEEALEKPEKASEAGIETVKEPETEAGEQDRTSKNIPEKENASDAIEQLKKMNAQKENKMSQEKDIISINSVEEDKDIKEETREEIREEESFNADEADTETTYITKGTKINGDLETDGSIDIIGTVDGNISCKGKVVVGGHVIGDISAGEVYANNAKVEGSIKSYGSVKVGVGSMVIGSVGGESAVIAGAVNGDIDVKGPVIVDSTAVIMGNIKSRSVQINNGAVIEGFCSQSYSDIDVKSFFA